MFFAGLAQGFSQAQEEDRRLQAQVDEQSAQREQATLLHLATTHPDPEVRASAMGAMLTPRQPAGGFMGRMFNAAKTNPAMPSLMALMGSQRQVPVMGQQQVEPGPSTMQEPGAGTLATPPPGATGELGIPQASMADTHNLLPQGAAVSQPVQTGTQMVSRGAPPTSAQIAGQTSTEQYAGRLKAVQPYLTPEQMHTAALSEVGLRVPMTGQFMGNQQKADGSWVRQERYFDANTGQFAMSEVPIAAPTALQPKPVVTADRDPADGHPITVRVMPDGTKTKLADKPTEAGNWFHYQDRNNVWQATLDPKVYQQAVAAGATNGVPATTPLPDGGASLGGGTTQQAIPPPGAPTGPAASTPPPAGAAAATPLGTPPPAPTPAAGGTPRTRTIGQGKLGEPKNVEGAVLGPDGNPQVVTALQNPVTGQFHANADDYAQGTEYQGFIPGKEGPELIKAVSQSLTTESTLDRAIAAIKASGYENSTDTNDTAKIFNQYAKGGGENPLETAVAALTSFAKIQGGGQYIQGTRSFKYIEQIQQHLPTGPTVREAAISTMTNGMISPQSDLVRAVEGTSWDSPRQMLEKLQLAKTNLQQVRSNAVTAAGKTPEHAVTGKAAEPPPVQQPGPEWTHDANGRLLYKGQPF
jgi:hypothetical protein